MNLTITPMRPHLFKAFYEWACLNDLNPHISLRTDWPGVSIPEQYYASGKLTLCIRPDAVVNYLQDHDGISFTSRFNQIPHSVFIPMGALTAIFSKVTGAIMPFEPEPLYVQQYTDALSTIAPTPQTGADAAPRPPRGKPQLRIVK